jgi:TolB-like protein
MHSFLRKTAVRAGLFLLSAAASAQSTVSLDEAIRDSVNRIETKLERGAVVAVVHFQAQSEMLSDYVIQELITRLADNGLVRVVDRENLGLIAAEMNFQLSGDVSDESMQSLGKKLGAQSIITGAGESMGGYYRIRFRVLRVETAEVQDQSTYRVAQDRQLVRLLDLSGNRGMGHTNFFVGGILGLGIGLHSINSELYDRFGLGNANPKEESGFAFPLSLYGGYRILDRLAIQSGLSFLFNNTVKASGIGWSAEGSYSTLDIPILARYSILLAPVELDLLGGFHISLAVSKLNLDAAPLYQDSTEAKGPTFGITLGVNAGYKLGPGSVIGGIMFVNDFNPIIGKNVNGKETQIDTRRSLNIMAGYQYSL